MTAIAVFGAGSWGTAVAVHLARKANYDVRLWGARPESCALLVAARENVRLLPGVPFPPNLMPTHDAAEAVDGADWVVVGVPTAFLRATLQRLRGIVSATLPVVSLTKGIEATTFERPTQIIAEVLGTESLAMLSGPSHAEEVGRGMPTSVVVASPDTALAARVQHDFGSDRFRIYTNGDLPGLEYAGALKNVLGIAAGICDGLGYGDNAKAALLTRGLVEMTRFGVAHGADPATFVGLAGIGDLITTCFSRHGRNRRVGERLAKGETLADVLAGPTVSEGVYTSRSVFERCRQMRLEAPIMAAVYRVVHENQSPGVAVRELMTRQQRGEAGFGA